jgi:CIC family chloride channel protein
MISLKGVAGFYPPLPSGEEHESARVVVETMNWWLLLIPTLGGLVSGFLVYRFAPEAEGHGTDGVIKAFHHERGIIRGRVPIIKTITAAITIGTGGSAGREGPIAQIGAGFASNLASRLKLPDSDRRTMVISGMAAGIGSIFRSPIGGALFAVESLYKEDMETEGLVPAITSSIVGYSIYASWMGWNTIFSTPEFIFRNPVELLFYALFGVLCALLGILYVKVFYGIHDKFALLPIPKYFKPAIGGFLLGVLALFFPYILGSGYGWIQMAIDGHLALEIMLLAAILKVFATSFSIGSGGSGGIFAPSLFMGAMLGGAFGGLANQFFPDIITQPTAFVLVGMAAFFAGAANVPISMTIMITEMTGGYALLVPLILASTLAFFIARKWSIYSQQVKNHAESPAHRGELIVDILNDISVESAYKRPKGKILQIRNNLPIQRILPLFANREEDLFPVVNEQGKLTGLLSMSTLRAIIGEDEIDNLIVAEDIKTQLETVSPSENLHQALGKFIQTKYTSLPVVDEAEPDKVLGLLGYQDLITAYDNALIEWTKET